MCNRITKTNLASMLMIVFSLVAMFFGGDTFAETNAFHYQNNAEGEFLTNGVKEGDTYNYDYGNAPEANFDEENYINYENSAFVKKSVKKAEGIQGLFDVTLAIKGNQLKKPIDLVMVIDYSSSMTGEKLSNALKGLQEFGEELDDSLESGNIRIGIVAYNRFVYSTDDFLTDINQPEYFLRNTAESHTGTFMQKGLLEGQSLLEEKSRPEAEKMLVHIGDDSANRSYLPKENAQVFHNSGEIVDYNGYHTDQYVTEFQTDSEKYQTSGSSTDPNAVSVSSSLIHDATLGTIISIKNAGIKCYSVATAPSSRGEYIGRNLASSPNNYLSIDENLTGLGNALKEIANGMDKTIVNGTVTDPMGKDILLQGIGAFGPSYYQLQGWSKEESGEWQADETVLGKTEVTENGQIIKLNHLTLGKNEKITFTYQIRLATEAEAFKGETWYLCNGRTTLDPLNNGELLDFPIPSIKAPTVKLNIKKQWKNIETNHIPTSIQYVIKRQTVTNNESWITSDPLMLSKEEDYATSVYQVPIAGISSSLPLYNNNGENFIYSVDEIDVPDGFTYEVISDRNSFTIINTLEETEPSTTEPSTTEPSTTEPSTTEPSTTEPSMTEPSTTEPNMTEPSTTDKQIIIASQESSNGPDKQLPKTNENKKSSVILTIIGLLAVVTSGYVLIKRRNKS
ncbi:TPA: VWA domain-containing protein [Enterococcus faecium]|nr:VWA domain-containing protein [Enterococcus faecium]